MDKNGFKYGLLFGGEPVPESEKARVMEELAPFGSLSFRIEKSPEGWTAQCKEIPAIVAGNTNPNPNDIEIESQIRAAIFAVLNVQTEQTEIGSPYLEAQRFNYAWQ